MADFRAAGLSTTAGGASARPSRSRIAVARWRIRLTYLWRHRRWPALDTPRRFTELVQHRKLHDRDPRLPMLADKVAVKAFVAERIGTEWVIPTLWHGTVLPAVPAWPMPFVVKSRHGCKHVRFVHGDAANWSDVRRTARRWTASTYGVWLDEWLYREIPHGIMVEPFIGPGTALPIDYKFYVFGGRVEAIQVHLGRGVRHRWIVFDRAWRRLSRATGEADPAAPLSLRRMIDAAERLGAGIDFVRVDLYEIAGAPLFGEMTFYPGSGLDRFDPIALDTVLGSYWLRARERARNDVSDIIPDFARAA